MPKWWQLSTLILALAMTSGCQLVVPSVRTDHVPVGTCGCGGPHYADATEGHASEVPVAMGKAIPLPGLPVPAFMGPAPESEPPPPPFSKFHPVPTRPVFYPAHEVPELEVVPTQPPANATESRDYPLPAPRAAPQELLPPHERNAQPLPKVPVDPPPQSPPATTTPDQPSAPQVDPESDLRLTFPPSTPARRASASVRLLRDED